MQISSIIKGFRVMLDSPKVALGAALSTFSTGAATWLEILPKILGVFGTIAGIILSIVLIRFWLQKMKLEKAIATQSAELHRLQVEELRMRLRVKNEIE